MVNIQPFGVEQWMEQHETNAKYNVAETCCASISVDELKTIVGKPEARVLDASKCLGYGAIKGSPQLRENIARLYDVHPRKGERKIPNLEPEDVLVTSGAISANHLAFYALVGPGDHVIVHHPTYQQLYAEPSHLGAEVSLWKTQPWHEWQPNMDDLRRLVRPNTKLIVVNNPQNPTGAFLTGKQLQQIVDIASERNILILADEVYRPVFHDPDPSTHPPSMLNLGYHRVIATSSMSKAYALAGLRLGWAASRNQDLLAALAAARDYTTISVGMIDDAVATFALDPENVGLLLERNMTLVRRNFAILSACLNRLVKEGACYWVEPQAGTTAFVQFKNRTSGPVDAADFCERLLEEKGVMFMPGDVGFGKEFKGYVRIGYACDSQVLEDGLEKLEKFYQGGGFKPRVELSKTTDL